MIKPNISVFKPQILLNKLADNIPTVPQTVENESLAIDTKLLNQLDEKDISKALKDSEATIAEIDSLIDKNGRPTPKLKEKIAGETITANEMASFKYEMTELRMKMEIASSRFKEALTAINDHKEERITSAVKSFMATAEVALQEQTYNETAALQDGLLIELGSYKVNDGTSGEKMKTLANELVSLPPVNPEMSTAELSMTKQHLEAIQNEALAVYENYEAGKVLLAKNREAYSKAVADLESKTSMFAFMTGDTHKDSALRYYKKGIEELGAPNADANTKEEQELYGKKIAVLSSSALAVEKGFDDEKARKSAVQLANNFHISERQKVNATALPDGFNKSKETARAKFSKLGLLPDNATVAQAKEYKGKIAEIRDEFKKDAEVDRVAHSEHLKVQAEIEKTLKGKETVITQVISSEKILPLNEPADKFQTARTNAQKRMDALVDPTNNEECKNYTETVKKIEKDFREEAGKNKTAYAEAVKTQKLAEKAYDSAEAKKAELEDKIGGFYGVKVGRISKELDDKFIAKLEEIGKELESGAPTIGDNNTELTYKSIQQRMVREVETPYEKERLVARIGKKGCEHTAALLEKYHISKKAPSFNEVEDAFNKDAIKLGTTETASNEDRNSKIRALNEAKAHLMKSIVEEKALAAAAKALEKIVATGTKAASGLMAKLEKFKDFKIHEADDEDTQIAEASDQYSEFLKDTQDLSALMTQLNEQAESVPEKAKKMLADTKADILSRMKAMAAEGQRLADAEAARKLAAANKARVSKGKEEKPNVVKALEAGQKKEGSALASILKPYGPDNPDPLDLAMKEMLAENKEDEQVGGTRIVRDE